MHFSFVCFVARACSSAMSLRATGIVGLMPLPYHSIVPVMDWTSLSAVASIWGAVDSSFTFCGCFYTIGMSSHAELLLVWTVVCV